MKILYLHGLNSTNVNDRTKWLSNYGKVFHPLMLYKNVPQDYKFLDKWVNKHRPDLIVGSSMGGFLAFHLGNYYNITTFLLNPALIMMGIIQPEIRSFATQAKHYISLGIKDEVIMPETTKIILKQLKSNHKIFPFEIGHETDFETFKNFCQMTDFFNPNK